MLEKVNMTSAHSLLFFDSPRRYAEIKIFIGLKMLLELLAKTLFGVQLYFHASMQEFCYILTNLLKTLNQYDFDLLAWIAAERVRHRWATCVSVFLLLVHDLPLYTLGLQGQDYTSEQDLVPIDLMGLGGQGLVKFTCRRRLVPTDIASGKPGHLC